MWNGVRLRRSAPLTRRFPPSAPTDLAAPTPAARANAFMALHLNDVVYGSSGTDNLGLTGQESIRPRHRAKQKRTGGEATDHHKLAHESSPSSVPANQGTRGNKV